MVNSSVPRYRSKSRSPSKLSRLDWAAGIAFTSYGTRIGVRVNDPAVLEKIPPYLPPGWKPVPSPLVDYIYSLWVGQNGASREDQSQYRLYAGPKMVARTHELTDVLRLLESHLEFCVSLAARRRLFVHAGVVGWRGRAIVIPGRSRTGKTSLVAALVQAGASYYSDEFAVFDPHGRVHPYPRPLSIRGEDGEPVRQCPVQDLGGRIGRRPLPVGLVAITEYVPGARWRPRSFSPAEAVLALLDNTVMARYYPEIALPILHRAVSEAVTLAGKRNGAEHLVALLLDQLAQRSKRGPGVTEPM